MRALPLPHQHDISTSHDHENVHQKMLSRVSDDLKSPLASIMGSLEKFKRLRGTLPPEREETLISNALEESYRLDQLITHILDMARLEIGTFDLQPPFITGHDTSHSIFKDCLTRLNYACRAIVFSIYCPKHMRS